jgi:hypothetical protein
MNTEQLITKLDKTNDDSNLVTLLKIHLILLIFFFVVMMFDGQNILDAIAMAFFGIYFIYESMFNWIKSIFKRIRS